MAKRGEVILPKLDSGLCALGASIALFVESGGDEPDFVELMIENDEAVVKPDAALRQLKVVARCQRQARLDELFQFIAEVAEAAPKRKRQIDLLKQFVAIGQTLEQFPRVAKQRALPRGGADGAA